MTETAIGGQMTNWTLDDIDWTAFDPGKVDAGILSAVKASALVEHNAADYVIYLSAVFADDTEFLPLIEQWGHEEHQHGLALGRWAQLADPEFDFEDALARFQKGYSLPLEAQTSVRGSPGGEMISRCVIESGTSSYYSALRDACDEPVLRSIAGHIAADEFRHYQLFRGKFDQLQKTEQIPLSKRLRIALGRIAEAEDDELAYAYWCATVPPSAAERIPYHRRTNARAYENAATRLYHHRHIRRMAAMTAKAVGLRPNGILPRALAGAGWATLKIRGFSHRLLAG